MMRYSLQPRDQIFVKGYGFLSFAKNMGKNIDKNISKSLSCKYRQKLLDHAKKFATNALKTSSKRVIRKTALTVDKIANKITGVSKNPQQNNSETVVNENDKVIPKKRYISPEER